LAVNPFTITLNIEIIKFGVPLSSVSTVYGRILRIWCRLWSETAAAREKWGGTMAVTLFLAAADDPFSWKNQVLKLFADTAVKIDVRS